MAAIKKISVKQLVKKYGPSQGLNECSDMIRKVQHIAPKVILEIGVHLGKSLALWNEVFEPDILIGVDNDYQDAAAELIYSTRGLGQVHYLAPYDSQIMDTWNEITNILGRRQVDFLFIDGNHQYAAAKYDLDIYGQLVRRGGIIAMHDVNLEGPQWHNLVETKRVFEEVTGDKAVIQSDGTGVGLIYV